MASNAWQTQSRFKIQDLISEGKIRGFATDDHSKSVFFDDTTIDNYSASEFDFRYGNPSQDMMPSFPQIESTYGVGNPLKYLDSVVKTTHETDIDAVRVIIQFNSLYRQNDSGKMRGRGAKYRCDVRVAGASVWELGTEISVINKSLVPFEESITINKPTGLQDGEFWEIQVTRLTVDYDDDAQLQDNFSWKSMVEIKYLQETYPNSAYVGVDISAEDTGGSIPRRSYDVFGIEVRVPTNWTEPQFDTEGNPVVWGYYTDPTNWNGTFKTGWTDDPVWLIYDLLTNERYGMGLLVDPDYIDIGSFYAASQYNMELIPDGLRLSPNPNGLEPRFRYNNAISVQDEAAKIIAAIGNICNAYVMADGNYIRLVQDRPTDVSGIITNADVTDGLFTEQSNVSENLTTAVNLTYNDATNRFLPKVIQQTSSADDILKYGYNVQDVAGAGITSEGQAYRTAQWVLQSPVKRNRFVSFSVGWQKAFIRPGEVYNIADTANGIKNGQIKTGSNVNTIVLDRPVTLKANITYDVFITLSDGTTESRTVQSPTGTHSVLSVSPSFSEAPVPGHAWALSGDALVVPFRIMSVNEDDRKGVYNVTAQYYDEQIYYEIENGVELEDPTYKPPIDAYVPQVTDATVSHESYSSADGTIQLRVNLEWGEIQFDDFANYVVQWRVDGSPYTVSNPLFVNTFSVEPAEEGVYDFAIFIDDRYGRRSLPYTVGYELQVGNTVSYLQPPLNLRVTGTDSTVYDTPDLAIEWDHNAANDGLSLEVLKDYVVEVNFLENENERPREFIVSKDLNKFEYTFAENRSDHNIDLSDGRAVRDIDIRVSARNNNNVKGTASGATFTNPRPSNPSMTTTPGLESIFIELINLPSDRDVSEYIVYKTDTLDEPTSEDQIVSRGLTTYFSIDAVPNIDTYLWVVATDTFDKEFDTLLYPGEYNGPYTEEAKGVSAEVNTSQYTFDGLVIEPVPDLDTIQWGDFTAIQTVNLGSGSSTSVTKLIPAGSAVWTGGIMYVYLDWEDSLLSTSTDLGIATDDGEVIVGTYKGGAEYTGGNGDAFMDGGLIIAQTISAQQLVADEAVITGEAQIASAVINEAAIKDAAITNAKIGTAAISNAKIANQISSINWNDTTKAGWSIEGTQSGDGYIQANKITIYDDAGGIILDSGSKSGSVYAGDGITTYAQATEPTDNPVGTLKDGDLWYDTDDGKNYRYDGLQWNYLAPEPSAGTDGILTYSQASEPTGGTYNLGDLWFDTDSGWTYRWNGSAWNLEADVINSNSPIGPGNASTYIADAAIANAQIADLAVQNANVGRFLKSDNYNGSESNPVGNPGTTGWYLGKDASNNNGVLVANQIIGTGSISTDTGTGTRVEMGDDGNYLLWAGNGAKTDGNAVFYVDSNGSPYYKERTGYGIFDRESIADLSSDSYNAYTTSAQFYGNVLTAYGNNDIQCQARVSIQPRHESFVSSKDLYFVLPWNVYFNATRTGVSPIRLGQISGEFTTIHHHLAGKNNDFTQIYPTNGVDQVVPLTIPKSFFDDEDRVYLHANIVFGHMADLGRREHMKQYGPWDIKIELNTRQI